MSKSVEVQDTKINIGDTIRVYHKIKEDEKTRTQVFEGIVIAIKGHSPNRSFTVRKIASGGIGVEMIWPVLSPSIEKVEVKKKGDVKRAKLYYLRKRVGKRAIKVREKTPSRQGYAGQADKKIKTKNAKKKSGKPGRKHSTKKAKK